MKLYISVKDLFKGLSCGFLCSVYLGARWLLHGAQHTANVQNRRRTLWMQIVSLGKATHHLEISSMALKWCSSPSLHSWPSAILPALTGRHRVDSIGTAGEGRLALSCNHRPAVADGGVWPSLSQLIELWKTGPGLLFHQQASVEYEFACHPLGSRLNTIFEYVTLSCSTYIH